MQYLLALKTARDHFGMDAVAVMAGDTSPLSELIEAAETSPMDSAGFEVRIRTDQHYTTDSGAQVETWAIYDELPPGESDGEDDEEGEPLLMVVSGKELTA